MYEIDFGLFPITGLLLGGFLYAVYYWGLHLRCQARWSQTFIVLAMLLVTLSMFISPARKVQQRRLTRIENHVVLPKEAMVTTPLHWNTDEKDTPSGKPMDDTAPQTETYWNHFEGNDKFSYKVLFSDATQLLGWIYLAGLIIMLLYFTSQIVFLQLLRDQHEHMDTVSNLGTRQSAIDIYQIPATHMPFSFGHSVFIPAGLGETSEHYVLKHEMAHIRHRHFLCLCMLEILLVLNWYNPFVWMFFREMHLQQELEVDTDMIDEGVDREEYQLSLVSMANRQGIWILTQSAFLGEPLKKRLLFMNTPIRWKNASARLMFSSLMAFAVFVTVVVVSCQVREVEQRWKHPYEGCWALEGVRYDNSTYEEYPRGKRYKYVGDFGDFTFVCIKRNGININFSIGAMEQWLHNDTLVDVYGRPITYELEGNRLTWRWHILPGEEYEDGRDQLERWRRTDSDPQLVELFRAITYPEQAKSHDHNLNGVWHLDSIIWVNAMNKRTLIDVCLRDRKYLIINEPYYMWIEYWPKVNEQIMSYEAEGHCGELHEQPNGYLKMQDRIYKVEYGNGTDCTSLNINITNKNHYFHLVPMPKYLRRIFGPALAYNNQ